MITIYTDGACIPNPGSGGWSFVAYDEGKEIFSRCGGDVATTNNIMEMTGIFMALDHCVTAGLKPEAVKILSDSQYCVKGATIWRHNWAKKGWRRGEPEVANVELWQAIAILHDLFPCKIDWVRGHNGIVGNERADALADQGRSNALSFHGDIALDILSSMPSANEVAA